MKNQRNEVEEFLRERMMVPDYPVYVIENHELDLGVEYLHYPLLMDIKAVMIEDMYDEKGNEKQVGHHQYTRVFPKNSAMTFEEFDQIRKNPWAKFCLGFTVDLFGQDIGVFFVDIYGEEILNIVSQIKKQDISIYNEILLFVSANSIKKDTIQEKYQNQAIICKSCGWIGKNSGLCHECGEKEKLMDLRYLMEKDSSEKDNEIAENVVSAKEKPSENYLKDFLITFIIGSKPFAILDCGSFKNAFNNEFNLKIDLYLKQMDNDCYMIEPDLKIESTSKFTGEWEIESWKKHFPLDFQVINLDQLIKMVYLHENCLPENNLFFLENEILNTNINNTIEEFFKNNKNRSIDEINVIFKKNNIVKINSLYF